MLIQANTCRTCKFVDRMAGGPPGAPEFQCRRYPPVGGPVVVPVNPKVVSVQIHGGFLPVMPDWWCGEFKPRIAAVENAMPPLPQIAANQITTNAPHEDPFNLKEYLAKQKAA